MRTNIVDNNKILQAPELATSAFRFFTHDQGQTREILRVGLEGFYVKGVRVPDTLEGYTEFYQAFKKWMQFGSIDSNRLHEALQATKAVLEYLHCFPEGVEVADTFRAAYLKREALSKVNALLSEMGS